MAKWLLFSTFLFLGGAFRYMHPLKMTVCDVKYHPDKEQLVFKFKFFRDDLEDVLERRFGKPLDLSLRTPENDQCIAIFIAQNFDLRINGAVIKPRLFQTSIQDVVLLAECQGVGFQKASNYTVDLTDTFMLTDFSDQYNLVRFDFFGNGNLETFRFEKAESHLVRWIGH